LQQQQQQVVLLKILNLLQQGVGSGERIGKFWRILGIEDDDDGCFHVGTTDIVLEVACFHEFSFSFFFFFFFSLFLCFFIQFIIIIIIIIIIILNSFLVTFIGQLLQGTLIFNPLNLPHLAASPCVFFLNIIYKYNLLKFKFPKRFVGF
jgi:hypothetical protein